MDLHSSASSLPMIGLFLTFDITGLIKPLAIQEFFKQNKKTVLVIAIILFTLEVFRII